MRTRCLNHCRLSRPLSLVRSGRFSVKNCDVRSHDQRFHVDDMKLHLHNQKKKLIDRCFPSVQLLRGVESLTEHGAVVQEIGSLLQSSR